jgi:ribosomal protein S16
MNLKNKSLIIKFWNRGKKHYPIYEILLSFKINNKGYYIEKLGFYNPNFKNKLLFLNTYRLAYWLNKGVLINKSIKNYLIKYINNHLKNI